MKSTFESKISGTGSAFPKRIMTNRDLEKKLAKLGVETNDEWIRDRTGIAERRVSDLSNPDERNSALGYKAALKALEMAGRKPEDVDQILYATCTPDTLVPSTACHLQARLGAKRAWAVDLNAACSGFIYGVAIADQFIKSGHAKVVLVVGAEVMSQFLNYKDRASCVLFGDGAGAAIVERAPEGSESKIISAYMESDGGLADLLDIPAGGSNEETTPEAIVEGRNKLRMKGKEIFKEATRTLTQCAEMALKANNLTLADIDWFVPHQANLRIIEAVARRLKIPKEKIVINIDRFANTSGGTVPTALDEAVRDGRIKKGDMILLDVFGAGLTYGSIVLRW